MKKQFYHLPLFLVVALCISCVTSTPKWYRRGVPVAGFLTGFGEGKTPQEARTNAMADIAEQLKVRISAETRIETKGNKTESTTSFEREIKTVADIKLTGIEPIREEKREDLYYAFYRYDIRPLRSRVTEAIKISKVTGLPGEGSNFQSFLPFSLFLQKHNNRGFRLFHDNGIWQVTVASSTFPVSSQELTSNFFTVGGKDSITLVQGTKNGAKIIGQQPDRLKAGQVFTLRITPPLTGYITLFYVDNGGITLSLAKNKPIQENETFIFPDPKLYPDGFTAEPVIGHFSSIDMIFAIFTTETVDHFARFGEISEQSANIKNSELYGYGRLLEILSGSLPDVEWSSKIIHIGN